MNNRANEKVSPFWGSMYIFSISKKG